jgi:glycosyltransferase involved in cell wall biosynthesis
VPALAAVAASHQLAVFGSLAAERLLAGVTSGNLKWHGTRHFEAVPRRLMWEQTVLPWYLHRWQADVLLAPFDIAPLFAPCPIVLAVRNPMPTAALQTGMSATKPSMGALIHHTLSSRSCRRARIVFYPTAFAAQFLGDAMNVPLEKRRVVFHGTDTLFWADTNGSAHLDVLGIRAKRYVLFVSRLYPQKNPSVLLKAYQMWRREHGDMTWRVVFVGSHTTAEAKKRIKDQAQELGIGGEAMFLENVEPAVLRTLYEYSSVFVLPTVMETFGQPFVEAMAAGAPVIAADTAFARELCQDAARYFSPLDVTALAEALQRVLSDPPLSDAMKRLGLARSRSFSWEREARETLALLEESARSA